MENNDFEKKWTDERKKLLLTTRLKYERDFNAGRRKKSVLWEQVLREIKEVEKNFPYNRDEIYKKFLNLMVTYKRIKRRNSSTGEAATTWEYFDTMDEVYGTRDFIAVPQENLNSSLTPAADIFEDEPATSSPSIPGPSKKRKCDEVLEFLKADAEEDKILLKELLELEKNKLEVEKEKIKEMRELKVLLRSFID